MLLHADPARAATFVVNAWNEGTLRPFDGKCDPWGWFAKDCLLRDAIAEANANPGPDTIVFAIVEPGFAGVVPLSRTGVADDTNDRGDLDAWDSDPGTTLEIVGPPGGLTIVAAQPSTERILHALPTSGSKQAVNVILDGVTLSSGFQIGGPGGCVLVEEGHLTTTDVVFEFCVSSRAAYTPGQAGGGAVAAYGGATMVRTEAWNSASENGDGGGIYVAGDLTVDDLTLMLNEVLTAGDGGGLAWSGPGATASLGGVQAWNNETPNEGGGLYLRGEGGTLSLDDSSLDANASGGRGGAIWQHAQTASWRGVRLDTNTALNRGGGAYIVPGSEQADC